MNRLIGKNRVMRSVLAQLSVIISVSLMLTACPSNEGAEVVSDPEDFFVGPLAEGLPVFLEINEPYWAHDHNSHADTDEGQENTLSLYSIELPEEGNAAAEPVSIVTVSSDQVTSLNTVFDETELARTEISILVNEGNVFKVDHQKGAENSGSIRLLNHFVNKVCEIIPVEVVQTTAVDTSVTHTVLHSDEVIYVVTAEGAVKDEDCADPARFKRYWELPLNFQFNAHDDDDTNINVLNPPVEESLARAKLMFGWVDDEVTEEDNDFRLTYGYLGYSAVESKLRFYDEQRSERWCQPRALQTFDVEEISPGKYSSEYFFELTSLEDHFYQLQMGLDVFVFDSTTELFSKPGNNSLCELVDPNAPKSVSDLAIESILTDRIFKTDIVIAGKTNTGETVQPVTAVSDDNEVLIIQDNKVYRYNYPFIPVAEREVTRSFTVVQQSPIAIDKVASQVSAYPFSQFDLKSCSRFTDAEACNIAHDVEADDWQFITACDASKGCTLPVETADFCATADELIADPTAGSLCTVLDYRHLEELNTSSNDAEFRGFMQYAPDYINSLGYTLYGDNLYITARMSEKEILLKYAYNIDLSNVKTDRETVLFGDRKKQFGLDIYLSNDNLFVTTLWETQRRENECYKDYQQVECDLGSAEKGAFNECSGLDLENGDCFDGFQEYESMALFCSAQALIDGDCSDTTLITTDTLAVNGLEQSAKWLSMLDLATNTPNTMFVLMGDKATEVDEGVLASPILHRFDDDLGAIDPFNQLGQLDGKVEAVRSAWISNNTLARFDVTNQEIHLIDQVNNSVADLYLVTDPLIENADSNNKQIINAGEVYFPRQITNTETETAEE